jgi:hypothetical protein
MRDRTGARRGRLGAPPRLGGAWHQTGAPKPEHRDQHGRCRFGFSTLECVFCAPGALRSQAWRSRSGRLQKQEHRTWSTGLGAQDLAIASTHRHDDARARIRAKLEQFPKAGTRGIGTRGTGTRNRAPPKRAPRTGKRGRKNRAKEPAGTRAGTPPREAVEKSGVGAAVKRAVWPLTAADPDLIVS